MMNNLTFKNLISSIFIMVVNQYNSINNNNNTTYEIWKYFLVVKNKYAPINNFFKHPGLGPKEIFTAFKNSTIVLTLHNSVGKDFTG